MTEFDYVIVGGGSAGCVLANRLTENPEVTVCLLETGPPDNNPLIHIPAMFAFLQETEYAYQYETSPQKEFNEVTVTEGASNAVDSFGGSHPMPQNYQEKRKGFQPRGRTLGGSSSVNGMVYIRGHKWDYDHWASLGNEGWSYDDVLPYFTKSEHNESLDDDYHGKDGPLNVAELRHDNPFSRYFVEAGSQHYPINHDFNGAEQEGIGLYQVTQKNGKRCSAAVGYLNPVKNRKNLTILTDTIVDKVIFENLRAVSVKCKTKNRDNEIHAKKEILLCGGAYGSPTILQRSGIGNENFLQSKGIECLVNLKGVGENLQDHIDYITSHRVDSWELFGKPNRSLKFFLRAPLELLKYVLASKGMWTSNLAEGGAFIKSDESLDVPDLQLHFTVAMVEDHGRADVWGNGFSCHVCLLRPKSVGTVKIASKDTDDDPIIDPNYLSHEDDMKIMIKGYKKMMEIMNTKPLKQFNNIRNPININDDKAIESAIRTRSDTIYHPVGTCKMGNDDMAVVDSNLRVKGVSGLRVIDASIMPTLIGGNTNAPAIMIAEKAADLIKNNAT
jgi:choline dehydrogenase-like flavoprotein